jgi:HK97 gp10 family phage protein
MSDRMSITVDNRALFAAMDSVVPSLTPRVKAAAKVTADNIAREARARVRRRTGQTGDAITVEETHNGDGYVVFVGNDRHHIGHFLEFGTEFMTAKPFLFVSARLEEGSHERRVRAAIDDVIAEKGLGD